MLGSKPTNRQKENMRKRNNKVNDYMSKTARKIIEYCCEKNIGILFVGWANGCYVLLHQFMKKTQKTPAREIEKAKRELADLKERGAEYE